MRAQNSQVMCLGQVKNKTFFQRRK
jgi:hypothetical protein